MRRFSSESNLIENFLVLYPVLVDMSRHTDSDDEESIDIENLFEVIDDEEGIDYRTDIQEEFDDVEINNLFGDYETVEDMFEEFDINLEEAPDLEELIESNEFLVVEEGGVVVRAERNESPEDQSV
jgi:hypothetical protein